MAGKRARLLGWWYLSIGAGFFLLGLYYLLLGQALWTILLRWVISAGFFMLGFAELRFGLKRKQ
ncbi:MAG: hypothetical protein M1436_04315 [Acidobacteria bacterium]|nr:hypothetical protein [Acidobacteriota bacterium]